MREPKRAMRLTTGTLFALIAVVLAWQLTKEVTPTRLALAMVLALPLLLPIKGLLRGDRRTYAWSTLCVIPYFVLGVTEAVANPPQRIWAATCLTLALILFVSLILYLRITRED